MLKLSRLSERVPGRNDERGALSHPAHRMWTPNSASPKPRGYLRTRTTPSRERRALFGKQRRRRARARFGSRRLTRAPSASTGARPQRGPSCAAGSGSSATQHLLPRRRSMPNGARRWAPCHAPRLLLHAPRGPHWRTTPRPSSSSPLPHRLAAAAPRSPPQECAHSSTDLSAAAGRSQNRSASAAWVAALPLPRHGQNGHSSATTRLGRPSHVAAAPPPHSACGRSATTRVTSSPLLNPCTMC